jgi:universal protein Kae1
MKYVLGIESTAHTFGASVVSFDGQVLSNARKLFTTESGGFIPAKVSEHHEEHCDTIISQAISDADISFSDVSLISFSQSPGIGHCLRIGAAAARSLSLALDIPLIGVNHCIAHLEIGRLQGKLLSEPKVDVSNKESVCSDPILLYCSGANTQVIAYEASKYRIFGETLDMGIGNFLDQFARYLDLGFPGGPKIEQLAKKGKYVDLPYSVKGMDVNFGGLLTRAKQLHEQGVSKEDLCYSIQEIAFAMLIEVTERALAHTGKKEVVLGGGVACNKRLQEMVRLMCEERGAQAYAVANEFNVDNAAMIAWTGRLAACNGAKADEIIHTTEVSDSAIDPYLRTDEIDVTWRT